LGLALSERFQKRSVIPITQSGELVPLVERIHKAHLEVNLLPVSILIKEGKLTLAERL